MKKFVTLLFAILLLGLVGCDESVENGRDNGISYPYIEYRNSSLNFDHYNRCIGIKKGFALDEGHSYDIVETEKGYDIIFHFVELEEKK